MASAAVNGSTLAVSFAGNDGGGVAVSGGTVSRGESSPEGGTEESEVCYYRNLVVQHDEDDENISQHHSKPSSMEAADEKAMLSDAKSEDGDSIKRPSSAMEEMPTSHPTESNTPPLSSSPVTSALCNPSLSFERSSKKRRKQSNPVRLATSMASRSCNEAADAERLMMDYSEEDRRRELLGCLPSSKASVLSATGAHGDLDNDEDVTMSEREDFDGGVVYRCPHCSVIFDIEEQLRDHIEDEHVQKALERQLQQQNQKNLFGTTISLKNLPSLNSSPYDLSVSSIALRFEGRTPDSSSSEHSAHEMKQEEKANLAMMQAHQQFGFTTSTPTTTSASPMSSAISLQSPKDMASLMALSGFGSAPFLIPILPCGNASSAPTATSMTSRAGVPGMSISSAMSGNIPNSSIPGNGPPIRIFNPEAFCELCNKEFCNKYFLKTHKANKHGIYSADVLAGTTTAATTASSLMASQVSSYVGNMTRSIGPGGSPSGGQETSPHSGSIASACISSGCSTTSVNSISSAGASVGYSMAGNIGLNSSLLMSSMGPGKALPVMNPDAFCDICQKEFCNKYFLRKHRQKIHGIFDPSYASGNTNSLSGLAESLLGMPLSDSGTSVNTPNSGMNASGNPVPPDLFYEYGARDLSAKIAAATQALLSKHGIQNLASTLASSPSITITSTTSTAPNLSTIPTVPPSHFTSGTSGSGQGADSAMPSDGIMVAGYIFSPDRLREMGVINVDAFCEICCKEFCNKYFLRTHKMNKHGIGVSMSDALFPSLMSKGMHHHQSAPLSLVVDKESQLEEGEKSATPSSSHSSSSRISTNGQPLGDQVRPSSTPQDLTQETSLLAIDLTCDVCSRPFSSAYLLKMHKFYFHNIGDAATAASVQLGNDNGPSPQDRNNSSDSVALKPNPSSSPEVLERRCSSTSSVIKLASGDNSRGTVETSAAIGSTSGQPINEDLQKLQTMIMDLNATPKEGNVKCNICFREMKNKYFLRAHMMNEHGELHNEDESLSEKGGSKDLTSENMDTTGDPETSINTSLATSSVLISSLSNSMPNLKDPGEDPESFCELCCKEFCSKYFLRIHKINVHGIGGQPMETTDSKDGLAAIPLPIPLDRIKMEGHSSAASLSNLALQITNTFPMPSNSFSSAMPPMTMTERPPLTPVTGRNFCEICNKELCNKYFMKTHMLKMHGINVEDKAGVNGATIGGVTCDICQKELCSKYFLKVHKQNTHGIFEEPTMSKENYAATAAAAAAAAATVSNLINSYDKEGTNGHYTMANNVGGGMDGNMSDGGGSVGGSGHSGNRYFSHYTEVCPLCDRRFKSIKWLKTHVINDHADLAKENGLAEVLGADFFFGGNNNASSLMDASTLPLHSNRPHHLSPRDYMLGSDPPFGIKVEKPSSSSSSATTSPNATSPFHLHSHHHHHHHHQQHQHSHRPLPHTSHAAENDNTTSGERGGGGGGGNSTAVHHAGELGSTGAAAAGTMGVANITTKGTLSTSSSSSTSSIRASSVPTSGLAGPLSALRKPLGTGSGTRIYLCSYCSYSTRWLSNLYAHEKRHTGLSSEGEKRFCCRVCHRAYRYNHSLQRHLVSHKTTGILMKHVAANFSSSHHLSTSSAHQQNAISAHSSLNRQLLGQSMQLQQKCLEGGPTEGGIIRTLVRPKPLVHRTVSVGSNGGSLHTSGNQTLKQTPARVKKYRCSKCGAKYRSREQCLEHIHMHHNTRNRNNNSHNPRGASVPSPAGSAATPSGTPPAATASGSPTNESKTVFHCPVCPYSSNNRDAFNFHLAKHQGEEDAQHEEADDEGPNQETRGPAEELSEQQQQQLQQHHLQLMQNQQSTMGHPQLPMTYAVPQTPPSAGSFIMQPFLVTQADNDGNKKSPAPGTFVPSLVYLPVSHKVDETLTVAFTLTPA